MEYRMQRNAVQGLLFKKGICEYGNKIDENEMIELDAGNKLATFSLIESAS